MERKNYFNFLAFRKGLYDIELSERARVIYMHLLQKSSAKGSDEIELTKALIASDLGILTKKRDAIAPKNVQRSLDELEARNYIQRWQKYKGENAPLTIKLNLDEAFLRQKQEKKDSNSDKNEQSESEKPSENVHHYNHYLSSSKQSLSFTNLDLSSSNINLSDTNQNENQETEELEKEFSEEVVGKNMIWEDLKEQYHTRIEIASTVAALDDAKHRFVEAVKKEMGHIPVSYKPEVDELENLRNKRISELKTKSIYTS
jgi:hypothetical protein